MDILKQISQSPKTSLLVITAGVSVGLLSYLLMKTKSKEDYHGGNQHDYQAYYDEDDYKNYDQPNEVIF